MTKLLIVEDQPNDLQIAAESARSVGITDIEARTSYNAAKTYLEKGMRGDIPLPDGIVLDLDLGYESGYELLRFWHSNPELAKIPIIIWTLLGEEQREICTLFKVNVYISKWEGVAPFREALLQVISRPPNG
jgi:CheY-like chemotaxis protein